MSHDAQHVPAEALASYLPSMGLSSMLHFGSLVLAFALMPAPAMQAAHVVINAYQGDEIRVILPQPEPVRRKDPPALPVDSDTRSREGTQGPDGLPPGPPPPPDFLQGDHDETVNGKTDSQETMGADLASLGNAALEVSFVPGRGMPAVRGWKDGRGRSANPYGRPGKGGNRNVALPRGGERRTEDAVERALAWLSRHQAPSGAWEPAGFDACCEGTRCPGGGMSGYAEGVTGLALLAFLGHGETAQDPGRHRDTVRRGLGWLRGRQSADGGIGDRTCEKHLYSHAIAALALAEAVGMGDYGCRESAQKAVNYLLACQNPGMGWRYRNYNLPGARCEQDGNSDTSVTGWALMALKSARLSGLAVPDAAFQGASDFLDRVSDPGADYRGSFGYTRPNAFVHKLPHTTTAVGVLCRQLMGQNRGVPDGVGTLLGRLPDWKSADLYYWYYATMALFQGGGEPWARWNAPLKDALCGHQEREGCAKGSWDPAQDTWGDAGGRAYATAMGALCLEVYYRYDRGLGIHAKERTGASAP